MPLDRMPRLYSAMSGMMPTNVTEKNENEKSVRST